MIKLCEFVVQFFDEKGWTPKKLLIWLAVGWFFQIVAGIGLITYLISQAYLTYQKGKDGGNERSSQRDALRDWPDSSGNIRAGDCTEGKTRDRTWVN